MQDNVVLKVNNWQIKNFTRYCIDANIYEAADAFSVSLADPEITIATGMRCELIVNDKLEMTGIIDAIETSVDKNSREMTITGRDLMGLLIDCCCEEFPTLQNTTVKSLAERLLRPIPYINRKQIVYQEIFSGRTKKKAKGTDCGTLDTSHRFSQIEPGMTVFEVLKEYAASRGLMLFSLPDGTIVFGKPKAKGDPLFTITCTREGSRNNVLSGCKRDDISRRYSKITVVGQQQGTDDVTAAGINTKAVITDSTFPFYKPLVERTNNDYQSPSLKARLMMERSRFEGLQLTYRAPGHSYTPGQNWMVNELCTVEDEINNVKGDYLIYGRTFERSKEGSYTTLTLGLPGVVQ